MWRSARIAINADGRRCRASRLRRNIDMISSMVGLAHRYLGSGTVANCGASEVGLRLRTPCWLPLNNAALSQKAGRFNDDPGIRTSAHCRPVIARKTCSNRSAGGSRD